MRDFDLTFLEEGQIFGKGKLEIFKKYGTKAAISDFAILLGGDVDDNRYTSAGVALQNRTGWWWTKTSCNNQDVMVVGWNGDDLWAGARNRSGGGRPAFTYSSIQSIFSNVVRNQDGLVMMEFGEYPQKVCAEDLQRTLERLYNMGGLMKTGKSYTTDSKSWHEYSGGFSEQKHEEYEYNGKRYIRVLVNSYQNCFTLSDGRGYRKGNHVWVEVSPITWLVDEQAHIAITKDIIFAGVRFKEERNYQGNFEDTDIKQFLDNYFAKEILPNQNDINENYDRCSSTIKLLDLNDTVKVKLTDFGKRILFQKMGLYEKLSNLAPCKNQFLSILDDDNVLTISMKELILLFGPFLDMPESPFASMSVAINTENLQDPPKTLTK